MLEHLDCIDACNECATLCNQCAAACLAEDDVKALAKCIALDLDCAELCRIAASCMARGSEFTSMICSACAFVCDTCAAECQRHPMEHCQDCAQACRHCAEECRQMAAESRHLGKKPDASRTSAH